MANPKLKKFSNSVVCPYDPDAFLIEDYHAGKLIITMKKFLVLKDYYRNWFWDQKKFSFLIYNIY